jgi:chitodextrinase
MRHCFGRKGTIFGILLFILSSLWISFPVASSDYYYVSASTGDDNNTGTFEHPWRTIQKAANTITAGDTVYIREGTYYEEVSIQDKHGNNAAWITFRPYNDETVIVDGRTIPNRWNRGVFKLTNSSYIRITRCHICNSARCGVWINDVAEWIRIDNNTIINCSSNGIYTETSTSYTITNLSFQHNIVDNVNNNWSGDGGNTSEGISFRNIQYFDIGYNQVSRCGRECIDVKNGSAYGSIHHNTINTSSNPGGYNEQYNHLGIYCDGHNTRNHHINISCNYVYGDHGMGIAVGVEKPTGSLDHINIFNNIVNVTWSNAKGISIGNFGAIEGEPISQISIFCNTVATSTDYSLDIRANNLLENIRVENNILTTENSTILRVKYYDPTPIIILKNNLFHNYSGEPQNTWNNISDVNWGDYPIFQDPQLTFDFTLSNGSPARDNGTIVPLSTDYQGNRRPYRQKYDIGAYEYSTNTPTVFGNPTPANNTQVHTLSFIWKIQIHDPENDNFSWTIHCSNNQSTNHTDDTNGIKSLTLTNLTDDTTYNVWVNTTDSTDNNISATSWYTFTTHSTGSEPPPPPDTSNQHPIADASAGEPYQGILNTPIFFNGSNSYDPDGTITIWFWAFGDNTNGTGETISHSYTTQGTYTVTLFVTDNNQSTNTTKTTCMIAKPDNHPPTKPTINGTTTGTKNTPYSYIVRSTDADNDTICYAINWGEDTSDKNKSAFLPSGSNYTFSHQWKTAGIFTITVRASDNQTESEPTDLTILIDVRYTGTLGYLINQDEDDTYERFYSNSTHNETTVQQQGDGQYLIDSDGDGQWDHRFNPTTSDLSPNTPSTPGFELTFVLCAIAIALFLWKKNPLF